MSSVSSESLSISFISASCFLIINLFLLCFLCFYFFSWRNRSKLHFSFLSFCLFVFFFYRPWLFLIFYFLSQATHTHTHTHTELVSFFHFSRTTSVLNMELIYIQRRGFSFGTQRSVDLPFFAIIPWPILTRNGSTCYLWVKLVCYKIMGTR